MGNADSEEKDRTTTTKVEGTEEQAYLVLWWLEETPYVARFRDEIEAESAARVRNAMVIEVHGRDIKVPRVVDFYRRDERGRPMPAKWKDIGRQVERIRGLGHDSLM
ncbi:MAG: hypothetical protein V3U52_07620 [Thermoplasmata archaeon]